MSTTLQTRLSVRPAFVTSSASDRLQAFPEPNEHSQQVMPSHHPRPQTHVDSGNGVNGYSTSPPSALSGPYPLEPSLAISPSFEPPNLQHPPAPLGFYAQSEHAFPSSSVPQSRTSIARPPETTLPPPTRQTHGVPPIGPSTSRPQESSPYLSRSNRSSLSDASTGYGGIPAFPPVQQQMTTVSSSSVEPGGYAKKCQLHIRQHPRAARAGPDGKDRRAIDPPPIVQLLMDDFDPDSEQDVEELHSQWWVVYCSLISAQSPDTNVSTLPLITEDGRRELQRLLLGTLTATPTPTDDDPDPPTMPSHPNTRPPSPTSRFLPASSRHKAKSQREPHQIPGTFFIFADLSVRKAGEYRLRFDLMKLSDDKFQAGSSVPTTHSVVSDVFKVVNAKDFDQVQPSTNLVKGLLERGAGFPLKLKKGTREGQRRKRTRSELDSEDDSNQEDNYD